MADDELAIQSRANDLVALYARSIPAARAWVVERLEESADPAATIALEKIHRRWPDSTADHLRPSRREGA